MRVKRVVGAVGALIAAATITNAFVLAGMASYNQNLWITHLIESAAYLPS